MKALSRRKFATIAAVAAANVAANASEETPEAAAERLYRQFVSIIPEKKRIYDDFCAALAALPAWCVSGPRYMAGDGSLTGPDTVWPMIQDAQPVPGHVVVVRPSPADLKKWYGHDISTYRAELRALIIRRRESHALCEAALGEKEDACGRKFDQMLKIEDAIKLLPPTPNSIGALTLINGKIDFRSNDNIGVLVKERELEHMRPALTGLIAEHVDRLIAAMDEDPTPTIGSLEFLA